MSKNHAGASRSGISFAEMKNEAAAKRFFESG